MLLNIHLQIRSSRDRLEIVLRPAHDDVLHADGVHHHAASLYNTNSHTVFTIHSDTYA